MTITIHRDRTFEYQGETWRVIGGGPGTPNAGYGYEVVRERDGATAQDGLMTMREVRDWLAEMEAGCWPLIEEDEHRPWWRPSLLSAASHTERGLAYRRAQKLIASLESVRVPEKAMAQLEERQALMITAG